MQKFIIILVVWFCVSCGPDKIIDEKEVGEFVDVEIHQGGWNAETLSEVQTTEGKFVVSGVVSGIRGQTVILKTYTTFEGHQRRRICVLGRCYLLR